MYFKREISKKIPTPTNNYYYSNISYDKKNKVPLVEKKKIIHRKKIHLNLNDPSITALTDKRFKNYFHKPISKNIYNNNLDISADSKDKNEKINDNIPPLIPRRSDFILNKNLNLTLNDRNSRNKAYNDINNNRQFLIDEISLSSKRSMNKSKDIKDELYKNKEDLKEKIQKLAKILNSLDNDDSNLISSLKTNYNDINNNNNNNSLYTNKYNSSFILNKNKSKKKMIEDYDKINNYKSNNTENTVFIKNHLLNKNNFIENGNNKIESKYINKEQKIPYRKINIGYKDKINDKNYTNYNTNIVRENDSLKKILNISTFPEIYFNKEIGKEIIRSDYKSITGNNIKNYKIKNNINQNNQKNNFNLSNYNTEGNYPSFNKKKIGLYKNYDEFNYLSNNGSYKKRFIFNPTLNNYMNKIDDNIFDINQTHI